MSSLSGIFPFLIIAALGGTVLVLILGMVSLARGGEKGPRRSNRLMQARVIVQALAVGLLLLGALLFAR